MGWIDIATAKETQLPSIETTLRNALDNKAGGNSKHLDSLMVLAKTLEFSKQFKEALNVLNDAIAMFKTFLPPLIEKAKVFG